MFCDASGYHETIKNILQELDWKMKVFIFGGQIEDTKLVSNLLLETGDECNFV